METPTPQEPAASPASQYEFTESQNALIEQLSGDMSWVAVPLIIIGILYAFALVLAVIKAFQQPHLLLEAALLGLVMLFFLTLGIWTRRSATAFHQIVTTKGRDIEHLMTALDELRKQYKLLSAFVKVYV